MTWWQKPGALFRALFRKSELDREMDDEMRSHIELQAQEHIRAGMAPEQARNRAQRDFGWAESLRETCRDQRGVAWLESLAQDLRFGLRMLCRKPGFTTTVVLTLALGIGANTAIFSVVNAVLLRPLPYRAADRIVMLWANNSTLKVGTSELPVEALDLPEWRAQATSFEAIAAFRPARADLSGEGEPERLAGAQISANLFSVLGVRPFLGRTFRTEEEKPGNDKVVVLSHGLWIRRFGGQTNLVGRAISLNGQQRTVVAIMPPGFSFPRGAELPSLYAFLPRTDVWLPLAEGPDFWNHDENRVNRGLIAIARVKPAVSLTQAQAEMRAIAGRQAQVHPNSHAGWTVALRSLPAQVAGETRGVLFLLMGVVTFVLLIACANLASLFLCRSTARTQEMAIRAALGAGRGRVIRQLLTESLLFWGLGGMLGLLLGTWSMRALLRFNPVQLPRLEEVGLDGRVLAFTAGITILTGLVFGLVPAFFGGRVGLSTTWKSGGEAGPTPTPTRQRTQSLLVIAEVAFALVLLTGAGLMLKSFVLLRGVDLGFDPQHVVAFDASLPKQKYPDEARVLAFFREAQDRLRALPGVQRAAAVSYLPLGASAQTSGLIVQGRPLPTPASRIPTQLQVVSPGYFAAMGIRLVRGRDFAQQDTGDAPPVCIINQAIARSVFAGLDPLGEHIRLGDGTPDEADNPFLTIVGVAQDVRGIAPNVPPSPEVYFPLPLEPRRSMTFVVRATGVSAGALERTIRAQMKSIDPALPMANFRRMPVLTAEAVARPRFSTVLFGLFAATALLLTVVGVYGVVTFAAAQRRRDLGIRIALGAQPGSILRLILRQGMGPVVLGLVSGLGGALGLARFLSSQLYQVRTTDPATFLTASALLLFIALLACWLPACRAARIDPVKALRCE